ncbi:MAG: sulfurtransferase TusA family protein [alpha proteobacterium HIMB59]|nr:MAG: sulfurtransferase TusA family protein [alpha proteobacterium HIMB59]|tara:strand:+ start:3368 stop:3586 length:219 start_codon:yes stop_codon:yes gene_type:complete
MEYFLDTKGFECPIPVLKANKFIKKLNKKDTILIESDDPLSKFDFKNYCKENNYKLISIKHSKDIIKIKIKI